MKKTLATLIIALAAGSLACGSLAAGQPRISLAAAAADEPRTSLAATVADEPRTSLAAAAADQATPFYTRAEAPHLENVLPAPPQLTDIRFADDWSQYLWGKSIRDTQRGRQAVEDATLGADYFMKRFSAVMDCTLTKQTNPILHQLLLKAHMTEMEAGASAKAYFRRVRPYQQFHEPSGVPSKECPTDFTSYPSGHTHISWLVGMILTAIDPAHTEQIMKVAYELGQSRVIVGYHYQSDVDAGRIAASITFARLCAMPEFLDLLNRASAEFNSAR